MPRLAETTDEHVVAGLEEDDPRADARPSSAPSTEPRATRGSPARTSRTMATRSKRFGSDATSSAIPGTSRRQVVDDGVAEVLEELAAAVLPAPDRPLMMATCWTASAIGRPVLVACVGGRAARCVAGRRCCVGGRGCCLAGRSDRLAGHRGTILRCRRPARSELPRRVPRRPRSRRRGHRAARWPGSSPRRGRTSRRSSRADSPDRRRASPRRRR